jgi:hypothetical protein
MADVGETALDGGGGGWIYSYLLSLGIDSIKRFYIVKLVSDVWLR